MNRRNALVRTAGALAAATASTSIFAQSDKPITIVVPYAPGGATDILSRLRMARPC